MNFFEKRFGVGIIFIFLASTILGTHAEEEDKIIPMITGVELFGENSSTCAELTFRTLETFFLCSFVEISLSDRFWNKNFTIMDLRDESNYIVVYYKNPFRFVIDHNGQQEEYLKMIDWKWIRICLSRTNGSRVELSINYQNPKKFPLLELEPEQVEKDLKQTETATQINAKMLSDNFFQNGSNATICIGNSKHYPGVSVKFKVAGLTITDNVIYSDLLNTNEKSNECFEILQYGTLDFNEKYWNLNDSEIVYISADDLCLDTFVILFINQSLNYEEHSRVCKNLNGRFLHNSEINLFSKYFDRFWNKIGTHFEDPNDSVGLYLTGGSEKARTLKSLCSYVWVFYTENKTMDGTIDNIPCIIDVENNFCVSPAFADFTYYGALLKYDTNYFIHVQNYSLMLSGDEGSYIKRKKDSWVLKSAIHKETWELTGAFPVGRNSWNSSDGISKVTFTHCKRKQFACTNGDCLSWNVRCNGVVECFDKSDEENCIPVKKEKGYAINMVPPPKRRENVFKILYSTVIFNIADITSEKAIAVVDVMIVLSWYDPRIVFWNPVSHQNIDCKEIWSPLLSMADAARSGFQIKFENYRSFCQILRSGNETNINKRFSHKDPYMGTYVKGEDMKISYVFSGLVTVPCRFNLRRYPFGTQTCNITFWADNAYTTTAYEFVYAKDNYKNYTQYEGRKELGEYHFLTSDHVIENKTFVTLIIRLQNLYGYHMLNSFTPSILICIITYSTLFFPITYFNERVMVSLTALLVLAALFTQASNKSVMTPYFKLLDIWYVVLISYCFSLVAYNIVLHKIITILEKRAKRFLLKKKNDESGLACDADYEFTPEWKKKAVRFNFMGIIFFSSFYIIFIFFFCIAAAEII